MARFAIDRIRDDLAVCSTGPAPGQLRMGSHAHLPDICRLEVPEGRQELDAQTATWITARKRHFSPLWALVARVIARAGVGGDLHFHDAKGQLVAGEPAALAPRVIVRVSDPLLPLRMLMSPTLAVGEAYMDGRLVLETGKLDELLELGIRIAKHRRDRTAAAALAQLSRWYRPANNQQRAADHARYHYDKQADFYRLFLDQRMQYSCAYFPTGTENLDEAQAAKIAHIAAKLALEPGQSVLDIGCGWGTLAIELAEQAGVQVTGITLAPEQHAEAVRLAEASPARSKLEFLVADYRQWSTPQDRIVSVGMLEHVGAAGLRSYFRHLAGLLRPGGVALVHAIGCWDGRSGSNAWFDRYIFPGGHIPSLSQVVAAVEKSGLRVLDAEILRLHYAFTLAHWSARFSEHRDEVKSMFGERFCRMWEFYLAASEAGFRHGELMVFQLLLAHERDALPLTRDYVHANEPVWRDTMSRKFPTGIYQ